MNDEKLKSIFVTKPYLPDKNEFMEYLDKIWENQWLTNQGPLHIQFETELRKYLDVQNVVLNVNGHLALESALQCLDLQKGGEIITTPFTFSSTPHSIVLSGFKPVYCDIKEADMTIDETKIESLINKDTVAILPVHVYGHPCNVKKIDEIATKYKLKVVYDAAHAFGVKVGGKGIARFGDISMFSFHATKLFHSIEGGALAFNNNKYYNKLNAFKNFGIIDEDNVDSIGRNAKMNEFQAAMGLCNLKHIEDIIEKRKIISVHYKKRLNSLKGIKLYNVTEETEYNFAYMPITINESEFGISRDELYIRLKNEGIYTRKYFSPIVTDYNCYKNDFKSTNLPNAKNISKDILTIPIYHTLSITDVDRICSSIELIQKKVKI